jgi:Cu/Ag efflux protein CusF
VRPLTVAVLLNLALVLGAGWGYAWWGRRVDRLETELRDARGRADQLTRELAAVRGPGAPGAAVQEWRLRGVVRAIIPALNVVVITHEDIPGYMGAMTMGFRVASPEITGAVRVGDAVRFTLRGTPPSDVVLTAIQPE